MAFNVSCEPSEALLLAMRARCGNKGTLAGDSQSGGAASSSTAVPAASCSANDSGVPSFKVAAGPCYAPGAAATTAALLAAPPESRPSSAGAAPAFRLAGGPSSLGGASRPPPAGSSFVEARPSTSGGLSAAPSFKASAKPEWPGPPNFHASADFTSDMDSRFQVGPGPNLHASVDLGQLSEDRHDPFNAGSHAASAMSFSLDLSRVGGNAPRSGSHGPKQGQQPQALHNKSSELRRPRPGAGPAASAARVGGPGRPSGGARSSSRGPKQVRAEPDQGSRRRAASSNAAPGGHSSGRAAPVEYLPCAEMPSSTRSKGSRPPSSGRPPVPTDSRPPDGMPSDVASARHASESEISPAAADEVEVQHVEEDPSMNSAWENERDHEMMKIPSVVTLGGVPVAADGDLVYLGGGIYAAAAPPPAAAPKQPAASSQQKSRLLPGRVRPLPALPRPAAGGHAKSVVRSASAHTMGSASGRRGRSDIEPNWWETEGIGTEDALGDAADKGSTGGTAASQATPAWRPAGPARLPKPPEAPLPRPLRLNPEAQAELGPPGNHSEVRARERVEKRRDDMAFFGRNGMLQELASMHEQSMPQSQRSGQQRGAVGAPSNSDARAAERKAAKEARVNAILEERAERLAHEQAQREAERAMNRNCRGSFSAPALAASQYGLDDVPAAPAEDVERQKLRVACKMEILDFFNGYHNAVGKMSAEQTRTLLAKLHGGSEAGNLTEAVHQCEEEREAQAHEWSELSQQVEDPQSIHRRLQQVNNFCNQVFDSSSVEGSGASMMQGY